MAVGVDWLQFKHAMEMSRQNDIIHSPKGTTWKDHKYVSKHKNEKGNWVYVYTDSKNGIVKGAAAIEKKSFLNIAKEKMKKLQNKVVDALYNIGARRVDKVRGGEVLSYQEQKLYQKGAAAIGKLIEQIGYEGRSGNYLFEKGGKTFKQGRRW